MQALCLYYINLLMLMAGGANWLAIFFEREPEREERIQQEIILDADGDEAIAPCWYKYLSKNLNFPFLAMVQTHKKRNPSGGSSSYKNIGGERQKKRPIPLVFSKELRLGHGSGQRSIRLFRLPIWGFGVYGAAQSGTSSRIGIPAQALLSSRRG